MRTTFIILTFILTLIVTTTCQSQIVDSKYADTTLTIIAPGDYFDGQGVFLSNELAKKYHFQYDYIGDLMLGDSLPLIGKHNDYTDSLLTIINGADWNQRFETEYSKAYSRDSILILFVKSRLGEYLDDATKKYSMVYRDSVLGNDIFRITILGHHNDKRASLMRFFVKYPELTIINIDKQIIYRRQRGE